MKSRTSFALGFLALIAVGAVVLMMPFCRADGLRGDFMSSLFTAFSAVSPEAHSAKEPVRAAPL